MTHHEDPVLALGRWLDAPPGSAPPSELDDDVVETVYALRPDLAPAPRLTADDILASVTVGPLASSAAGASAAEVHGGQGADVVPFPSRARRDDAETNTATHTASSEGASARRAPGRLWMWVGGTGGLGMALVAAATLVLVATPALQRSASFEAGSPAASAPDVAQAEQAPASAAAQAPAQSGELAPPTKLAPPGGTAIAGLERRDPVLPMADAGRGEATLIPELEDVERQVADADAVEGKVEAEGGDAVASADEESPMLAAAPAAVVSARDEGGGEAGLTELRAKAAKRPSSSGWRKGVGADALTRIDAAIASAASARGSGDPTTAAGLLAAEVGPPARAGQYLAALAGEDYLTAGNAAAAAAIAERGLALSGSASPERSWLLVVQGDALRALGDTAGAADAYELAR